MQTSTGSGLGRTVRSFTLSRQNLLFFVAGTRAKFDFASTKFSAKIFVR
jgi:hypothetical protein